MSQIRSAYEKALEKAERLGRASEEELARWRYVPEGERLAARYLKEDLNLIAELSKYQDNARRYLVEGAQEVLLRNIDLPRNDYVKKTNRKAMESLKALKTDKASVENVYSKIRRIFRHYLQEGEQQRKEVYQTLKREFEAKLRQAAQQQHGTLAGVRIDAESQPQFREEWRRLLAQLDSQYYKLLEEYKQEIQALP